MFSIFTLRAVCSPPPCGEGLGVGVAATPSFLVIPPSVTFPRKGGGDGECAQGGGERTTRVAGAH